MINTKHNIAFRTPLIILIFLSIVNCDKKEFVDFERQRFVTKDLINCAVIECADLEVNVFLAIGDDPVSKIINKEIELTVSDILNIGENEAEETIENAIKEFNYSYRNMAKEFPEETVPYEASVYSDIGFRNKHLISIILDSYVFTGGAHGYGSTSYINIDLVSGKKILINSLLKDDKEFIAYAENVFRIQNDIPKDASINSTGFFFENNQFSLPETIGITQNEVILNYNSYEISSYAEGAITVKLKKEEVASFFAIDIL